MNKTQDALATRRYREQLLQDPWRPQYHFCVPDGDGRPGDPNGCFYAQGLHHMMYLYHHPEKGFCWGHVTSRDLIHWRHHPDALEKTAHDDGCFSGGAFVDDDGTAYLSFWVYNHPERKLDQDSYCGIMLAKSTPPYDVWERVAPVAIPSSEWGIASVQGLPVACADPSNIWKSNQTYYMQTGNLLILNKYGRTPEASPSMKGDWTELFSSKDLKTWHWEGRFYDHSICDEHPDESEDDMCPSFLPLPASKDGGAATDEYLQLFISHNRGCQYYIGRLDEKKFVPRIHGRMSWIDDTYFAPEAYIDDKGRQIAFAWLRTNLPEDYEQYGWSGVMGLPRVLWRANDGSLGIAAAPEIDALAYHTQQWTGKQLEDMACINLQQPQCCRIEWTGKDAEHVTGLHVGSENWYEILCDPVKGELRVDTRSSGSPVGAVEECAPIRFSPGEVPHVTVYIDASVVEVFANDKQAITRRIFLPTNESKICTVGGKYMNSLLASEMAPSQPY